MVFYAILTIAHHAFLVWMVLVAEVVHFDRHVLAAQFTKVVEEVGELQETVVECESEIDLGAVVENEAKLLIKNHMVVQLQVLLF